jgi:hypothetical protein
LQTQQQTQTSVNVAYLGISENLQYTGVG